MTTKVKQKNKGRRQIVEHGSQLQAALPLESLQECVGTFVVFTMAEWEGNHWHLVGRARDVKHPAARGTVPPKKNDSGPDDSSPHLRAVRG